MKSVLLFVLLAPAQEGGVEILEAETLYQDGWLFTLSDSYSEKSNRTDKRTDNRITASINYGVLPELTLTGLFPYASRSLESGTGDLSSAGLGDFTAVAKYRFHRSYHHQSSTNFAVLGGLEFPTAAEDRTVPVSLQPGSGSWDPFLGAAATLERVRWKINAVALYQKNTEGDRGFKFGDEFVADFAVGNRFWIDPYPGPAASATLGLRWTHEWKSQQDGASISASGGITCRRG